MPRSALFWFLVLAAIGVGGCTDASSNGPPDRAQQRLEAEPVEQGEDPTDELLADETVKQVDWEAASNYRQLDPADAPEKLGEGYADSPVPVLLPDRPALLADAFPTTGKHWYSASMHTDDGVSVSIQGNRVARVMPDLEVSEPGEALIRDRFLVSRTHGIVSLSFVDFGVAYTVDVECARPKDDRRCTENDYVLRLAESLAVLGGGR